MPPLPKKYLNAEGRRPAGKARRALAGPKAAGPARPADAEEAAGWRPGRVEVVSNSGRREKIDAIIFGRLAVHQSADGAGRWAVTSATTGCLVCVLRAEADARRVAESLWAHCSLAFCQKTADAVAGRLGDDVRDWVLACRAAGAYAYPVPESWPDKAGGFDEEG